MLPAIGSNRSPPLLYVLCSVIVGVMLRQGYARSFWQPLRRLSIALLSSSSSSVSLGNVLDVGHCARPPDKLLKESDPMSNPTPVFQPFGEIRCPPTECGGKKK